jgi:hypothetical protein
MYKPKKKGAKKNKSTIKDYIEDLDAAGMTGNWTPDGHWNRIHGDGKSSTGGKWHMETMKTSEGAYKVKVVENDSTTVVTLDYGSEPSFETIVADLKAKY